MLELGNLFFYIYFAIMFGMRMWGVYEGKGLYGPLLVLGFLVWGISFLMSEHTPAEYIMALLLLGLAGLVYISSGEKGLLLYFTLMLGMKNVDVHRLFKVGIWAGGLGVACLSFLSAFGLIEDVAYVQKRPLLGFMFRHSMGQAHANTLSTSFVILSAMILYVTGRRDRTKVIRVSALLLAVSVYLFIYSDSRTGILMSFGLIGLNLFYTFRKKLGFIDAMLFYLLLAFTYVTAVLIPMFVPMETLESLKKIDSTYFFRFIIGKSHLEHAGLTLFGTRLNNPDQPIYGIDMSQLYLLVQLGCAAFIVVTALWIVLLRYIIRNNRIEEYVITVALLVMGTSDPFLYNLSYKNLAFIFMGVALYEVLQKCYQGKEGALFSSRRVISFGEHRVSMALLDKELPEFSWKKPAIVAGCIAVVMAIVSIALFMVTPNPDFVLADYNRREHKLITDLVGKTYTPDEIADELMYLYYTDGSNPVEGGYYTPNAGIVEKARLHISIFFWGTVLMSLVYCGLRRVVNKRNKINE